VATSEVKRIEAWWLYQAHRAYPGVIVAATPTPATSSCRPLATLRRWRVLLPAPGGTPRQSTCRPLDVVRIFVDIPEQDANYVHIGTNASVLAQAYRDEPIRHRHAHSWPSTSRADAPCRDRPAQPASQLLPGCTPTPSDHRAPGVRALPVSASPMPATRPSADISDGHAQRAEIRTGVSDGEWMEVTTSSARRRPPPVIPGHDQRFEQ